MTRPTPPYTRDESPDELTDGAWRFDPWRRVQVWVPEQPALFEEVRRAA